MKKFAFSVICTFCMVGYVMADEFIAQITKVDGDSVSFKKGGGFGGKKKKDTEEPKEETAKVVASVKVAKGEFDKDGAKGTGKGKGFAMKAGEAIEGGLKNEMFKSIDKGVTAQITTDDKGAITQILIFGGKGAGGKKKGG